jgi:hypothetical protein
MSNSQKRKRPAVCLALPLREQNKLVAPDYPYTILSTEHARSVTHLLGWPCRSKSTQVLPL